MNDKIWDTMQRLAMIAAAFAALPMLAGSAAAQPVKAKPAKAAARTETCESVSALAAGFGKENVTGFANGNLDLAIDQAKNRLADKGAKGFTVRRRSVACENYIDFGGSIGREHKCTATAQLCGKG
jgi:uncharacterized membrane protein